MAKKKLFQIDPTDDINFLMWQIMKLWQRERQQVLEEFDITVSQLEVLSAAYHLSLVDSEVTQIAISNSINIDPMTTSTVLRNLEKKELVKRKPSVIDTRARIVEVTTSGEEVLKGAVLKVREKTRSTLKQLDEEKLTKQLKVLLKVLTELN